MARLSRLYDWLLYGMAAVAGLTLVWLMVAVVGSVLMRNLGFQPFQWLFVSTEYGLLYMTMLGAPWLVRERGHVHIELVTAALPRPMGRALSRLVALACAIVSALLAWKGLDLMLTNVERGDYDVRAYYFPRWLLTASFPVSFGLMAVEFARFVVGEQVLHSGEAGIHE